MTDPIMQMKNVDTEPIIQMKNIEKHFGAVIALAGVSLDVIAGECHCLLGDNGAGKSTFIKTMSGVHKPTRGEIYFEGKPLHFDRPRDAIAAGIATVYQDLAMIPLMSVSRNFFMGNEPLKKIAGISFFDHEYANNVTMEEMKKMGINLRGPDQAVGTLSGGERQTVAIALIAFGHIVLTRTRFGNWIYASGGDAQAARYAGVPVNRVKILMFMFTAFCATVFATSQVMEFGSAAADRGILKEFEAIISVVIGGALLTGG